MPPTKTFPLLPTENADGGSRGECLRDQPWHRSARAGVLPADWEGHAGPRGEKAAASEDPAEYGALHEEALPAASQMCS